MLSQIHVFNELHKIFNKILNITSKFLNIDKITILNKKKRSFKINYIFIYEISNTNSEKVEILIIIGYCYVSISRTAYAFTIYIKS